MDMKRISIIAASLMCSVVLSAQTKEAAVLFSGTGIDESYLLTDNVSVSFENGTGTIMVGEVSKGTLDLDKGDVTADFRNAFNLTAHNDPDNTSNYYTTFYAEEGAYKVPSEAKAYIGAINGDVLNLTSVEGLIHGSEPVVLKASTGSFTLMPSANNGAATTPNALLGTETGITTAGSNVYALSLGQDGVGFYWWEGSNIGANKAYLELTSQAKAFTFMFEDEADAIQNSQLSTLNSQLYNLNGVRVNEGYKGLVIKNGKKYIIK